MSSCCIFTTISLYIIFKTSPNFCAHLQGDQEFFAVFFFIASQNVDDVYGKRKNKSQFGWKFSFVILHLLRQQNIHFFLLVILI